MAQRYVLSDVQPPPPRWAPFVDFGAFVVGGAFAFFLCVLWHFHRVFGADLEVGQSVVWRIFGELFLFCID